MLAAFAGRGASEATLHRWAAAAAEGAPAKPAQPDLLDGKPEAPPPAKAGAEPDVPATVPFFFDGQKVRVAERDGDPWFVAADVARLLGYQKPENAVAQHCRSQITTPKQGGGFATLIPERDVYRLIFNSHLPAAQRFEDWVVGTVLPMLRRTGSYRVGQEHEADLNADQPKAEGPNWTGGPEADAKAEAPGAGPLVPKVYERGGAIYADSRDVADFFGKRHDHVLRDARNLLKDLTTPKLGWLVETTYMDPKGEARPCIQMTKDGLALLAMGFTGEKALAFKVAYIEQFNRMEATLRSAAGLDLEHLTPAARTVIFGGMKRVAAKVVREAMGELRQERDGLWRSAAQVAAFNSGAWTTLNEGAPIGAGPEPSTRIQREPRRRQPAHDAAGPKRRPQRPAPGRRPPAGRTASGEIAAPRPASHGSTASQPCRLAARPVVGQSSRCETGTVRREVGCEHAQRGRGLERALP